LQAAHIHKEVLQMPSFVDSLVFPVPEATYDSKVGKTAAVDELITRTVY